MFITGLIRITGTLIGTALVKVEWKKYIETDSSVKSDKKQVKYTCSVV